VNSATLLAVLEIYLEAFAEHDRGRRGELLARCLTEDAEIWGPNLRFAGYQAISDKIAAFHGNWPDCRLLLASGPTTFAQFARFANAIARRDGSILARGETIVEVAEDGRISTVVPFWEATLPPLPEHWPRQLAVPVADDDRHVG
jgi:hypothetical protein